jgi:hypothetical protein
LAEGSVILTSESSTKQKAVTSDQGTQTELVEKESGTASEEFPASTTSLSRVVPQIQEYQARTASLAATQIVFTRPIKLSSREALQIQLKPQKFTRNWLASISVAFASVVVIIGVVYWVEALPAKVQALLWSSASTTIFTVGLLSYVTTSLLDALISASCNLLRWHLCARPGGVSMLTFTTLGNISFGDVLRLLIKSGEGFVKPWSSHRFWGFQRCSLF